MMIWISITAVACCAAGALLMQRLRLQRFLLSDLGCRPAEPDDSSAIFEAHGSRFQTRLGRKIFSREDLPLLDKFSPAIRQRYLMRKRADALGWLGGVRGQMRRIMRAHRLSARGDCRLQPREELALIANYWLFLTACAVVEAGTLLAGPLALRGFVERVCICNQIVSELALKSAGISDQPQPVRL